MAWLYTDAASGHKPAGLPFTPFANQISLRLPLSTSILTARTPLARLVASWFSALFPFPQPPAFQSPSPIRLQLVLEDKQRHPQTRVRRVVPTFRQGENVEEKVHTRPELLPSSGRK